MKKLRLLMLSLFIICLVGCSLKEKEKGYAFYESFQEDLESRDSFVTTTNLTLSIDLDGETQQLTQNTTITHKGTDYHLEKEVYLFGESEPRLTVSEYYRDETLYRQYNDSKVQLRVGKDWSHRTVETLSSLTLKEKDIQRYTGEEKDTDEKNLHTYSFSKEASNRILEEYSRSILDNTHLLGVLDQTDGLQYTISEENDIITQNFSVTGALQMDGTSTPVQLEGTIQVDFSSGSIDFPSDLESYPVIRTDE